MDVFSMAQHVADAPVEAFDHPPRSRAERRRRRGLAFARAVSGF